jgi:hypothetical protein
MSGAKLVNRYGWHDQEVVGAGLPDKRLARRLRCLLDQMSGPPGQPVPADWLIDIEAGYSARPVGHL